MLVRLAITLLDRGRSDVELTLDLLDTVSPVYLLLKIQCISTCEEGFLNPDTGDSLVDIFVIHDVDSLRPFMFG